MTTLEQALYGDFPPGDQGHPQTARTRRVRNILETAIALSGAQIEVYNFHERADCVYFNVRYHSARPSASPTSDVWVTAGAEGFSRLDALTDAALVQQWIPQTLRYGTDAAMPTA